MRIILEHATMMSNLIKIYSCMKNGNLNTIVDSKTSPENRKKVKANVNYKSKKKSKKERETANVPILPGECELMNITFLLFICTFYLIKHFILKPNFKKR